MFNHLKSKFTAGLAAIVLSLSGLAANAQSANNWTGLYLGGHVGNATSDADLTFVGGGWWTFAGPRTASFSLEGLSGGIHFGYGVQNQNNFYWGVEASFSAADLSKSIPSPAFPAIDTWSVQVSSFWDLAARAGYVHNQFLFYGTAGFAAANVDTAATPPLDASDETHYGYVLGIGADYMLSNGMTIGLQYKYYDFGSKSHPFNAACGPCNAGDNRTVGVDAHVIAARITSHF